MSERSYDIVTNNSKINVYREKTKLIDLEFLFPQQCNTYILLRLLRIHVDLLCARINSLLCE